MTEYEYTTSALVAAELRATQDFGSTTVPTLNELTVWIKEDAAEINNDAGQVYGSTSYTETFDYDGEERLVLRNAPIISVTNVLYSTSSLGTDTYSLSETKTEDTDYTVYNDTGEVAILFNNWSPLVGRKRIQATYDAGFTTTPLQIQKLSTKKVAKRVIDTLIEKDINEKKSGKSVSVGSISIIKPADFGVAQYETLSNEIATLEGKLVGGTSLYRMPTHRL
jgi:hypothetical protein